MLHQPPSLPPPRLRPAAYLCTLAASKPTFNITTVLDHSGYGEEVFHFSAQDASVPGVLYASNTRDHVIYRIDLHAGASLTPSQEGVACQNQLPPHTHTRWYCLKQRPATHHATSKPLPQPQKEPKPFLPHIHCATPLSGEVSIVAGAVGRGGYQNGPAADSRLNQPRGLCHSGPGDEVFFIDSMNAVVRRIASGAHCAAMLYSKLMYLC